MKKKLYIEKIRCRECGANIKECSCVRYPEDKCEGCIGDGITQYQTCRDCFSQKNKQVCGQYLGGCDELKNLRKQLSEVRELLAL